MHHSKKKDAPSRHRGAARRGRRRGPPPRRRAGPRLRAPRHDRRAHRPREIGVQTLRGGDVVGRAHRLLRRRGRAARAHPPRHLARAVRPRGAARGPLARRPPPGLYDMADVLGLPGGAVRICRFRRRGQDRYGVVEGTEVRALTAAPWAGGLARGAALSPLAEVTLLAPVAPRKVVCVGRNYRAHAKELGNEVPKEPLLFLKPSTAVIGPGRRSASPRRRSEVHHEAELAAVIGRPLTRAHRRRGARGGLRLDLPERRHRPRHPARREAVHARQGLRHLLPDRPGGRDRPRPHGPAWSSAA